MTHAEVLTTENLVEGSDVTVDIEIEGVPVEATAALVAITEEGLFAEEAAPQDIVDSAPADLDAVDAVAMEIE